MHSTILGTCDVCQAKDVELSRAFVTGIETYACQACCAGEPRNPRLPDPEPVPTFTRKLSWDEQRALSPAAEAAYWYWLFALNEPVCRRRELDQRHPTRDWDKQREVSRGDDYETTPQQHGGGR